jgi:hypothetical protein
VGLRWLCGDCAGPKKTAAIILDANSQIRFHKFMLAKATAKIPVHAVVHAPWPNTQYEEFQPFLCSLVIGFWLFE